MHYIKANPDWWVFQIFHGNDSHVSNLHTVDVREQHRIIAVKEEASSSHGKQAYAKQAYAKYVTQSDKAFICEYLALLCKAKSLNK